MASKPNASKMGRPSIYTPELAEKICELIRDGVSERKICGMPGMPGWTTLNRWKLENPDFRNQSARARSECREVQRRATGASGEPEQRADNAPAQRGGLPARRD